MSDSGNAIQAMTDAAQTKVNTVVNTVATGGMATVATAASEKPEVLGNYLATHYIGLLTYSEIMAFAAFIWVIIQILKVIVPLIINIVRYTMPNKPKKPTATQKTTEVKVKKPAKAPKATA